MTRLHYLLARNHGHLFFADISPLQRRLLCENGLSVELFEPGYRGGNADKWRPVPRPLMRTPPAYFLADAAYRLSTACKPPNFREEGFL